MEVSSGSNLLLLLVFVLVVGARCQSWTSAPNVGKITDVTDTAEVSKDAVSNAAKPTEKVVTDAAKPTEKVVTDAAKPTEKIVTEAAKPTENVVTEAAKTTEDFVAVSANTINKGVSPEVANTTNEIVEVVAIIPEEIFEAATHTPEMVVEEPAEGVLEIVIDFVYPSDVCYDGLGCFSMSSPWHTLLRPLPAPHSPVDIDTQFYLYTRGHPDRYTVTWRYNESDAEGGMTLNGSDFDGTKKTFFITHGFASTGNFSWMAEMKDALLNKFDCNVFLVDWGKGASELNYFQVSSNTRVVAAVLAKLGRFLVEKHNSDFARMHAIGHSLGAQISSYFGKNITTLGRITALDPAQPAFEHYDRLVHLDRDDAVFVDVVHTSARPFFPFAGLGMVAAYGHIDFYMNGGWNQPGCFIPESSNISMFQDLATLPVEDVGNEVACPHGRAIQFFTASLQINNTFWGHRIQEYKKFLIRLSGGYGGRALIPDEDDCGADKVSPFGYDSIDYPARGKFEVGTTDAYPYVVPEPKLDACMQQYRGEPPLADPEPNEEYLVDDAI